MMDVKEKVLQVMRSRAALQEKALGGEYPFTIATWNLRLAMEKEFPDEEWRSADCAKFLWSWLKTEQYPKIPMPAGLVRRYGDWR